MEGVKMAYILKKEFGVDEELFDAGTAALKVKSPFGGDKEYYVRSTYGGFDLYDEDGNKHSHVRSGTGNWHRLLADLYDEVEDDEED
jgi:hypothetical protein